MATNDYIQGTVYWPQDFPYWPQDGFYWPLVAVVVYTVGTERVYVVAASDREFTVEEELRVYVTPEEDREYYVATS